MDKIPIREQDVVPLESIADDVTGLRVLLVNVYAISQPPGDWMLIDSGLPYSQGMIRRWAEERFGSTRPEAIFLSHGHFDLPGLWRNSPPNGASRCMSTPWNCRT
jgi:Metallo-beta-lactamase superfamily